MATDVTPSGPVTRSRELLGRSVLDGSGDKVGSIRDILLDSRNGGVRYFEVDLGMLSKEVLIPVQNVEWGEDGFILRGWTEEELKRLPPYDSSGPLTSPVLEELTWAYPRLYDERVAADGPPLREDAGLVRISEARDFKVPKEEPDLRGWTVFGSDGERVGEVDDLLVDPAAMKVAYLVVDVMDDLFLLRDDRHVLIPTAEAEVRERGEDVWIRSRPAREIARLPAFSGDRVDPLVLERVDDTFRAGPAA